MKQFFPFLIILLSIPCLKAQELQRETIIGHVQVPLNEDPDGVNVYNLSAKTGTSTNEKGDFQIAAAIHDTILISAVQFETFKVVIDEKVIATRQVFIYVKELVNRLPDVIISPYDLTGKLETDLENEVTVNLPENSDVSILKDVYVRSDIDPVTGDVKNKATAMSQTWLRNGLNFINLFKLLLINNKKETISSPYSNMESASIDNQIRLMYDDDFFRKNLDIELEFINDFIFYADDHGLSEQMLKQGNELDLIQFLVEQSKKYKKDILNK